MRGDSAEDVLRTSDTPMSLVRPSWADPEYVMASQYAIRTVANVTAFGATQILQPDPRRIAVIFAGGFAVIGGVVVGPFRPTLSESLHTIGATPARFHIFDWGPLVTGEWWAYTETPPAAVVIYTIHTQ